MFGLWVVVLIWCDLWMVVGSWIFVGDLLWWFGVGNVFDDVVDRYFYVILDEICVVFFDIVLFLDELYLFSVIDGFEAFPDLCCVLVEGWVLIWYGFFLAVVFEVLFVLMIG